MASLERGVSRFWKSKWNHCWKRQSQEFNNYTSDFKKNVCLFLERGREAEREGKKQQCVVASHTPPTGDLARNPGMCPDWGLNLQPFGSQAGTQSTEPHQPGPSDFLQCCFITFYFEIIVGLWISCKNNTDFLYTLHLVFPRVTSFITTEQ